MIYFPGSDGKGSPPMSENPTLASSEPSQVDLIQFHRQLQEMAVKADRRTPRSKIGREFCKC